MGSVRVIATRISDFEVRLEKHPPVFLGFLNCADCAGNRKGETRKKCGAKAMLGGDTVIATGRNMLSQVDIGQ